MFMKNNFIKIINMIKSVEYIQIEMIIRLDDIDAS